MFYSFVILGINVRDDLSVVRLVLLACSLKLVDVFELCQICYTFVLRSGRDSLLPTM